MELRTTQPLLATVPPQAAGSGHGVWLEEVGRSRDHLGTLRDSLMVTDDHTKSLDLDGGLAAKGLTSILGTPWRSRFLVPAGPRIIHSLTGYHLVTLLGVVGRFG